MSSRAWILCTALLAVGFMTGCLRTQKGLHGRGDRRFKSVKATDVEFLTQWRRIAVGFKPKVRMVGYISTDRVREKGAVKSTNWVYDVDFHKQGFFTQTGSTWRKTKSGDYQNMGTFDTNGAVLIILREEGPANFYKVPPPIGSDRYYYDPLNPPKKKDGEDSGTPEK